MSGVVPHASALSSRGDCHRRAARACSSREAPRTFSTAVDAGRRRTGKWIDLSTDESLIVTCSEAAPRGVIAPVTASSIPMAFFFEAIPELKQAIEFGFVFPSYRRRGAAEIRRVPTARASIYYAADVITAPGAAPVTGMFCEGPHSHAFAVTSESGELVGVKVAPGGLRALLGIP